MNARLQKSILNRSVDIRNATSLRELPAGPSLSNMRAGQQMSLFGQDHAPANPSAWREKEMERVTKDTFGPLFDGLSPSADLQRSLENRLRQRMAVYGSPEYELTWKQWAMPSGPPICALRASGRRTSGNDCSGWPMPNVPNGGRCGSGKMYREDGSKRQISPEEAARMVVGWPTPKASEGEKGGRTPHGAAKEVARNKGPSVSAVAQMVTGWSTPSVNDSKNNAAPSQWERNSQALNVQAAALGTTAALSPAPMVNTAGYRLNPLFPLWLQGYPAEWACLKGPATRSSRKSRQSL